MKYTTSSYHWRRTTWKSQRLRYVKLVSAKNVQISFQLRKFKKWSSENTKIPRLSNIIQKYSICVPKYCRITRIYLCLKIIHKYSRFTEIPPSVFRFCPRRSLAPIVWDPTNMFFEKIFMLGVPYFPTFSKFSIYKLLSYVK